MKRVLVTGGAGFIGSAVCRYLVGNRRAEVLNLDKLTYAGIPSSLRTIEDDPLYHFERVDICDRTRVRQILDAFQPDSVMHLAAESHVDRSIKDPAAFMETNIMGTYTMLECAREYWKARDWSPDSEFRFLHISTDEVYGTLGASGLFSETTPYDPRSPYSASKASSDHLAMAWHHTYGLPVLISNCSNNYGPYHFPEKLVPLMILNALAGKQLPVYGQGDQIRDWLYVEDHARALDLILREGKIGETYNIGGHNEHTNLEVVETICTILDELRPLDKRPGKKSKSAPSSHRMLIEFVSDRPGHDQRYAIDATKLKTELGWEPRESFQSGLRKTVQWYLDNEWWWKPLQDKSYQEWIRSNYSRE